MWHPASALVHSPEAAAAKGHVHTARVAEGDSCTTIVAAAATVTAAAAFTITAAAASVLVVCRSEACKAEYLPPFL